MVSLIVCQDKEESRRSIQALTREHALIHSFYPDTFNRSAFRQETETLPLFAHTKCIVVYDLDLFTVEQLEIIYQYVEKPQKWVSLFLVASEIAPQSKLTKLGGKVEVISRDKEGKPWEQEQRLISRVIEEATQEGWKMSPAAAQALVHTVDPQMLRSELEKLFCFTAYSREITVENVSQLATPYDHLDTIWKVGDAICLRSTGLAIELGTVLLERGMAIFSLLAGVRTQFLTGVEILSAGSQREITQKFPYLKGKFLEKKVEILQGYGVDSLRVGALLLFAAETQAKNSSLAPSLILEIVCTKLTYASLSAPQSSRSRQGS